MNNEVESEASRDRLIPSWATAPFHDFLDHSHQAYRLVHLTMRGIAMVRGGPKAIEALAEYDKLKGVFDDGDTQRRLEEAQQDADLAQSEIDNGFPVLHEQALISLWGSLEALVKTVVVAWLSNDPTCFKAKEFEKLKVSLGDYMGLSDVEQCEYITTLLDQQEGGGQRQGIGRLECLLGPIGLSGQVESSTSKHLYELQQLRHVLVHRRGVVDRRLMEACPWLNKQPGEQLMIDHDTFVRLDGAVHEYVLELIHRTAGRFGAARIVPEEKVSS